MALGSKRLDPQQKEIIRNHLVQKIKNNERVKLKLRVRLHPLRQIQIPHQLRVLPDFGRHRVQVNKIRPSELPQTNGLLLIRVNHRQVPQKIIIMRVHVEHPANHIQNQIRVQLRNLQRRTHKAQRKQLVQFTQTKEIVGAVVSNQGSDRKADQRDQKIAENVRVGDQKGKALSGENGVFVGVDIGSRDSQFLDDVVLTQSEDALEILVHHEA